MVKIILGTNTSREELIVPKTTVLRTLLENNNVNYSVGTIHIDGCPIAQGDMDRTLEELNIKEKAFIIAIIKSDNA